MEQHGIPPRLAQVLAPGERVRWVDERQPSERPRLLVWLGGFALAALLLWRFPDAFAGWRAVLLALLVGVAMAAAASRLERDHRSWAVTDRRLVRWTARRRRSAVVAVNLDVLVVRARRTREDGREDVTIDVAPGGKRRWRLRVPALRDADAFLAALREGGARDGAP